MFELKIFDIITAMKEGFGEKFMRVVTAAILLVIVIGGLAVAYPTYRRGQSLRRQEVELKELIELKKREIAKLEENQRRFRSDPDFVEAIARQNRRVFPGELVFIFED